MADVRDLFGDGVGDVHIQLNPALVGDGGKVEHRVGRASEGHVHRQSVFKGLVGHDVPGLDVAADHLHDLHAGVFGQLDPLGVDGGDGAVAPEAHAEDLGQAVHRVGGVHAGAGAAGGAGVLFPLLELGFVDLAGVVSALGLEHRGEGGLVAVHMAGEHRAAGDEDGGDVEPGGGH